MRGDLHRRNAEGEQRNAGTVSPGVGRSPKNPATSGFGGRHSGPVHAAAERGLSASRFPLRAPLVCDGPTLSVEAPAYDYERVAKHDPRHPEPFPFASLTDDEFDELVFLLAQTSDRGLVKLRAPDGGLDTVSPSLDDPAVATWGIQAKLHRQHIKWSECRRSLDRAVEHWRPGRVTFAFPRDLTENQHKLFHKHLTGRHAGTAVDWWGASALTGTLLARPAARAIAKRFFNSEDPMELADRAIRAGAPLRTAQDLLERKELTGEFLQTADPHFAWVSIERPRSEEPVARTPGAVMRLEFGNGQLEQLFDAVPRHASVPEHFAPSGSVGFEDAATSRKAAELLRQVTSVGGRADLGAAKITLDRIPAPFDELLADGISGIVSVRARREAPPWAARFTANTNEGDAALDMDLAEEEPEPAWDARMVGRRHGLKVELRFVWSHSEGAGSLNVHWDLSRAEGNAEERARVLAFVIALHGTGTFTIADREETRPSTTQPTVPGWIPSGLRQLRRLSRPR